MEFRTTGRHIDCMLVPLCVVKDRNNTARQANFLYVMGKLYCTACTTTFGAASLYFKSFRKYTLGWYNNIRQQSDVWRAMSDSGQAMGLKWL